ncbi:MAG TPA: carboxypeptidase regulatory-like domain-containing protein [Bacteroidota bacterium]|nr:carboxypeptidase regulatory-like domain-containing protein [Bacteroidota bacterium]
MSKTAYHNQLDDHILGNLTPAEEKEFEEHLRQCRSCQEELDQLKDVRERITNLPRGIKPQRDLWPEIENGLSGHNAADKTVEEEERHRGGTYPSLVTKPRRFRGASLFLASPHLRAAALVLIVLGGGALWFATQNSRTGRDGVRKDQISPGEREQETSAQKSSPVESAPTQKQPEPAHAQDGGIATKDDRAAARATQPALRASPVEDQNLQFLRSSFVNYSDKLPNDRVYLQFDRPLYSPGETIWLRAYVRNDEDLMPSRQSDICHVEFVNPQGNVAQQLTLLAKDGVASGEIDLAENLPGGLYKIRGYTEWQKNFENPYIFEKEIQVQKVVLPRLKMKLDFERKAFGPGDNVIAKFEVSSLQNRPMSNFDLRYVVKVAGNTIAENPDKTDRNGTSYVSFDLPKNLSSTDGILVILVQYEGQVESISRSIPIVLNQIHLTLYPEGGDLVQGLSSRVGFEAVNEFNKPADIEGVVRDDRGREITKFKSFHQGIGAFLITPEDGRSYLVNITKPGGIAETFRLPDALSHGYTLAVRQNADGTATFVVGSTQDEELSMIAQIRGRVYFTKQFTARVGTTTIAFPAQDLPRGVVQATLFDHSGIEQAERLLFVNKRNLLTLRISTDKERYLPREEVRLSIKASDLRGQPAKGNFSLAVADDRILSFADDKSGNILAKMLLEPDLRGKVEEPNFYFDPKEAKADTALDYLMMTRGWRRFTWKEVLTAKVPEITHQAERTVVAGTVLYSGSELPVAGARVSISGSSNMVSLTDSSGKYRFRYVDLGSPVSIEVSKKGFEPYDTTLEHQVENLDCRLWKEDGTITVLGRIFDSQKRTGLADARVEVLGTKRHTTTDNQGLYKIKHLPRGVYTLKVEAPGYVQVENHNVRVENPLAVADIGMDNAYPDARHAPMALEFRDKNAASAAGSQTGKITGRLTDASSGEPIPGGIVHVSGTQSGAATDADGKYVILAVPAGQVNVRASLVGYQSIEMRDVLVGPNAATSLDILMSPAPAQLEEQVVSAQRALVNKSATNSVVAGPRLQLGTVNEMSVAPRVNKVEDVLRQEAGAVRQRNNMFMREGRADGARHYFDGIHANKQLGIAALRTGKEQNNVLIMGQKAVQMELAEPARPRYYRAREFSAPIYPSEESPIVRSDFRSTIFWKGDVALDNAGEAVVTFYNSDDITSFRATVEGISASGMVGRAEKTYYTQLPFGLSAKVPVEVSMGDRVLVPLTLKNNTGRTVAGDVRITAPESWKQPGGVDLSQSVAAASARTIFIPFEVLDKPGKGTIEIAFESEGLRDAFQQEVFVREKGYPRALSFSSNEKKTTNSFVLNAPIEGTVHATVNVYPSVASTILKAVDALLQEPNGCFEQTSSTNYPNVIALRYLKESGVADPRLMARATRLLDDGYRRLTTFETKEKGYEWFGATPPHEALTAYGLMQFKDMEPVYASVDKSMVDRTARWLMSRRDGRGGFMRDAKALDSFGRANPDVTNAYIVYALAEAGYTDFAPELTAAMQKATVEHDPYQLALVGSALLSLGDKARAFTILADLIKRQQNDGSWNGKTQSITGSSGNSLKIETTGLAVLALLKSGNPDLSALDKGVKFLLSSRSGYGGFGSTQGTIIALKALTAYTAYSKYTAEPGRIQIMLDGKEISGTSYEAGERGPIVIDGLEKFIAAGGGNHSLTVAMAGVKHPLPHSVLLSWSTTLPLSSDSVKVSLDTRLADQTVRMGQTVRFTAKLKNLTSNGLPMVIALVGIPGGLTAQPWQLKDMQEKAEFDFYEINGRYISFYYRQMKPSEERTINLDLKAEVPGVYEAPASSAYLYYTNEYKSWSSAGQIEIQQQ